MKNYSSLLLLIFVVSTTYSQVDYGTPDIDTIPEKLRLLPRTIEVIHFPKENDPIRLKDQYYWKHITSILCKESTITITEYGAYLFYNNQWNLRKSYALKELDKNFSTKRQVMAQGEPYTWTNNYRVDSRLFGGWALWYFIGTNSKGETVCGYETIHTTNNLLN